MDHKAASPHPSAAAAWKVPRCKAHLFNQQIEAQILEAIRPALFGDYWEHPRLVRDCEERFAQFIGLGHVAAVQSGTAALILALKAAALQAGGLKPGDEVITVANSDMSTTSAIVTCGARPVFCDVLDSDYTIDPERVEPLISERTRALLPVDLYGHPANTRELRRIARRHRLFIVQDAALATAARDFGRPMGAFADLACFSTTSTKQIGGIGNGGLIATADKGLRESLELYRGYGVIPTAKSGTQAGNDQEVDGLNLVMTPVNAAVVALKLRHLPAWTERRKEIALQYERRLQGIPGITLASFRRESEPVRREFALRVRDRDRVLETLRAQGIQAAMNYFPPAHRRTVYRKHNLRGSGSLPVTERISREILTLPVDPLLSAEDIDYVCDCLIGAAQS